MSSKTTSFILLKSQICMTCYADRGRRSGTPRWGYPSHRYRGGPLPLTKPRTATPLRRLLPASHVWMANISMPGHANMTLNWTEPNKWQMILRQITMSLENVTTLAGQVNTDPVRYSCRIDKSPLIFDPLDNRNPSLLINYQKVSLLEESQEVGMKWGLGRSTSFHTSM